MNASRCVTLSALCLSIAALTGCDTNNEPAAPDNTARNEVDRSGDTKTPMDQSESSAAIRITADIRRAIMDDSSMSTGAQNCKIITDDAGVVTLRGVVTSQAEKDSIAAKATGVVGVKQVDNQLEVKIS
jgi:osmotically-inducible protein OsmY